MVMLHPDLNLKKLVTKEDRFHLHKILGAFALCSFVYRYTSYGVPLIQFEWFDWLTMVLHFALALTAIQFRVPKLRIKDKPLIVYEEYRQHAIVFTSRCFFVYALNQWSPLVVLVHHLLADYVTSKHGKEGDTAVRSAAIRSLHTANRMKTLSKLFSLYQFLAIGSHLFGPPSMGFNALIAIQSSVFLMTLYKKKIIRGKTHLIVYSLCLLLSVRQMFLEMETKYLVLSTVCFLIRISTSMNKYLLWGISIIYVYILNGRLQKWATLDRLAIGI